MLNLGHIIHHASLSPEVTGDTDPSDTEDEDEDNGTPLSYDNINSVL